jgi:hypothetical protein
VRKERNGVFIEFYGAAKREGGDKKKKKKVTIPDDSQSLADSQGQFLRDHEGDERQFEGVLRGQTVVLRGDSCEREKSRS